MLTIEFPGPDTLHIISFFEICWPSFFTHFIIIFLSNLEKI